MAPHWVHSDRRSHDDEVDDEKLPLKPKAQHRPQGPEDRGGEDQSLLPRIPTSASGERERERRHVHAHIMDRSPSCVGWLIVSVALVTSSATAIMYEAIGEDISHVVRLAWRFSAVAVILGPAAVSGLMRSKRTWRALRKPSLLALVVFSGFSWFAHFITFVLALGMTSAANALLFNSLTPLLLLVQALIVGESVLRTEALGAVAAVSGAAILAASEGSAAGGAEDEMWSLAGDVLAFSGSFGGLGYMVACKRLKSEMSSLFFFWSMNVWAGFFTIIAASLTGSPLDLSSGGIFGWLADAQRLAPTASAAIVCDILGNLGIVAAISLLSPLVVSVLILLQPLIATAEGVVLRSEQIPELQAMVGMLTTVAGTALVVLGASQKSQTTVVVDVQPGAARV